MKKRFLLFLSIAVFVTATSLLADDKVILSRAFQEPLMPSDFAYHEICQGFENYYSNDGEWEKKKACMRKQEWRERVYEGPTGGSKQLGIIIMKPDCVEKREGIDVNRGCIMKYFWLESGSGKEKKFSVDFSSDVGSSCEYGCDIHTVLDQKGSWIKLPQRPFKTPVWINIQEAIRPSYSNTNNDGEPYEHAGFCGDVSELGGTTWPYRLGRDIRAKSTVTGKARTIKKGSEVVFVSCTEKEVVFLLAEQPDELDIFADCGELKRPGEEGEKEQKKRIEDLKKRPYKAPIEEFFDKDKHLMITGKFATC